MLNSRDQISQLSLERREWLLRRLKEKSAGPSNRLIVRLPRDSNTFPLSFAQERLWFMDQLVPGGSFYNIPAAMRLNFPLNSALLEKCLNEIVRRHESLRTTFSSDGGEPLQRVAPQLGIPLPVVDLSEFEPAQRESEALRLAQAEALAPFDLTRGPLVRTTLLRLAPADHVFLLTMHHIVSDGWSTGVLLRELSVLYQAFATGKPSPLAELRIQYRDFAVWQRKWLQGEVLERQLAYWRKQLNDIPRLQLPTDRPRPKGQDFKGAFYPWMLSAEVTAKLNQLSQQNETTLFMTLLAAFYVLLYRYTSQEDIAIGSYIANRNRVETEGLIGFFINTLVFRTQLSGDLTFGQLLKRVKEVALEAYAHQDLPFPKLVEQLQPERDLSVNPLFQVVLHLFNAQTWPTALGGAAPPPFKVERHTALFDIVFELYETPEGLSGGLEFSTELFEESTIARMVRHFSRLLEGIVSNPEQRLCDLPILSADEHHQLLHTWNATAKALPDHLSLTDLFEIQVQKTPDAVAFVADERCLTFAELNARVNQLSRFLQKRGVSSEVMVGICMERSFEFVQAFLAILKAGGAYVPLDPSYPSQRLGLILQDLKPPILLTSACFAERLSRLLPPETRLVVLDAEHGAINLQENSNSNVRRGPDHLAYVLYTSGSTGKPKGVAIEDRQVLNRLHWMWKNYPFDPEEVCAQKTGLNFVDSIWELLGGLLKGTPTVLIPDLISKELDALIAVLFQHRVTRIWLVPSLLRALLETYPDLEARLPDLRFWVSSGEALTIELYREFERLMPKSVLYNLYGTTEVWDVTWHDPKREGSPRWRVPIGRPIDNMQAFVLDTQGKPVAIGVAGELFVAGVGLARGYLNRAELNETKFVWRDLVSSSPLRLYRTGDLARFLPDGQLEFLGRLDHQIKIRGFRIELGEIETVLDSHPAVEKSAAVVRQDQAGLQRLIAYVVQRADYAGLPRPEVSADVRGESSAASSQANGGWAQDKVEQWRAVWDDTYCQSSALAKPTFNTAGFISSYTGQPIAQEEIEEWVQQAVDRILASRPKRVLEIGCGAGLLLWRVAPHCLQYVGTDFSSGALDHIRMQLNAPGHRLSHVTVLQRSADDFSALPENTFDMVVLHSVVQYFPSVDYLLRVIEGAVRVVRQGGSIYIGDVRHLGLLEAFHVSVESCRTTPSLALKQFHERVNRRLAQEQELAINPEFFFALRGGLPLITGVELFLKRGCHENEFSRFRYDVLLSTGSAADLEASLATKATGINWPRQGMPLTELKAHLETTDHAIAIVRQIPNHRLDEERALLRLLKESDDGPIETIGELRERAGQIPRTGLDPEQVRSLVNAATHCVETLCSLGADDCFDLICWRRNSDAALSLPSGALGFSARYRAGRPKPWVHYANNPLQGIFTQKLVPELRTFLEGQLPDHVVPSSFVLLETLPLTPSGKVDRKALPSPEPVRPEIARNYVAPRDPLEEQLAVLWTELLGLQQVGVYDHFFADLGGHSLVATQLSSRLRNALQIQVPLRWIFEGPTICALAEKIRHLKQEEPSAVAPIVALPRERYRTKLSSLGSAKATRIRTPLSGEPPTSP
jgi:amino acid adenylation domain-containing protein